MVRMRVIPVRTCTSRLEREHVVVAGSGSDRVVRAAVGRIRYVQRVPVDGGRLGQLVMDVDNDLVAFVRFERRTRDSSVIRIARSRSAWQNRESCLLGGDRDFYCMGFT